MMRPTVGGVAPNSAAERAGLKGGDLIEAVDGATIASFGNLQRLIAASPGRTVHLQVLRDGQERDLEATLGTVHGGGGLTTGQLGVMAEPPPPRRVNPGEAVVAAIHATAVVSVSWVAGLWQMLSGHVAASQLGGTLRIAQMSGQFAAAGTASLMTFMAILSINLGLVNLLPVPILDGGRLLFYAIEALRGRATLMAGK